LFGLCKPSEASGNFVAGFPSVEAKEYFRPWKRKNKGVFHA
jgi:hypothetical protein